jgi:hypothetical protein
MEDYKLRDLRASQTLAEATFGRLLRPRFQHPVGVSLSRGKRKNMPYALRPGYPSEWGGGCRESIDYKRSRLPPKMINGLPTLIPIAGVPLPLTEMICTSESSAFICHPFVYVSRRKREREKESPTNTKITRVLLHPHTPCSHIYWFCCDFSLQVRYLLISHTMVFGM